MFACACQGADRLKSAGFKRSSLCHRLKGPFRLSATEVGDATGVRAILRLLDALKGSATVRAYLRVSGFLDYGH
jgi:NADPH-dependent ferric siderophore reductase